MDILLRKNLDIEAMSGTIHVECLNSRATEFKVNMGKPSFISSDIPVSGEVREVIKENFVFHGKEYKATCLTVGNPHCIIFTDNVSAEAVKNLGPYVENADEFPERMNLQICRQVDKGNLGRNDTDRYGRGRNHLYDRNSGIYCRYKCCRELLLINYTDFMRNSV